MASILTEISQHVPDAMAWASLAPAVVGGFLSAPLTRWLPPEKELDGQVATARELLRERISLTCKRVFGAMERANPLRGDTQGEVRDVLGEFSGAVFSLVDLWAELRDLRVAFRRYHGCIIWAVIVTVVAGLLAVLVREARPYIGVLAVLLVVIQIVAFILCRKVYGKVKAHVQRLQGW